MSPVQAQPTLVEQVVNAIVSEIVEGELPSNSRLIQDELARAYGVSRQPVQQALLLLRDRGLVREAPGRGLIYKLESRKGETQDNQAEDGKYGDED